MSTDNASGEATFPDDLNGDVLRRLQRSGDDFTIPRDIDFSVVFPDEAQAETFAGRFRALGYEATVGKLDARVERPWDVTIVNHMLPTHVNIAAFERELEAAASPLGGENDGWGCIAQKAAAAAHQKTEGEEE